MLTARGIIALAGAAAALIALPASAAEIRALTVGTTKALVVSGSLVYGDGEKFERVAATLPKSATVVFESPGGNLLAGLKIGETIRSRGMTTVVGANSTCASACAIAWLGGTTRYLSSAGRLGFHAASGQDGVSGGGNALVGAYMAKLGLNQEAIYSLTSASPNSIAWLDIATARTLGISAQAYVGPSFGGSTSLARGGGGDGYGGRATPRPASGGSVSPYENGGGGGGGYGAPPPSGARAMPRPVSGGSVSPYENGGGGGYDGGRGGDDEREGGSRDDNRPSNGGR